MVCSYSTIWLARALPEDGQLVTCELEKTHADVSMPELAQSIPTAKLDEHTHITGQVARVNLERAKVSSKVRLHVGPAADTLRNMHPEQLFDLAFIDADKPSILTYFLEAKRLVRKGGVVVSKFPTFCQKIVAEMSYFATDC